MSRKGERLFFWYGVLTAIFLLFSSAFTLAQNNNPLLFLLFLPVVGYFAYYAVQTTVWKAPLPAGTSSRNVQVLISILFLILLSISLLSIFKAAPVKKNSVKYKNDGPKIISPTPFGTIDGINSTSYINIREHPSTASALIGRAKLDDSFPVIATKNGWLQIKFEGSKLGWVTDEFFKQDNSAGKEKK